MRGIRIFLTILLGSLIFLGCKIATPTGTQVAKRATMGLIKGPYVVSSGRIYFMEDRAVYKPTFTSFVRRTEEIDYSEIDTVTKGKFNILLLHTVDIKMEDGKKYKVNIPFKRKYLIQTLNNLKQ